MADDRDPTGRGMDQFLEWAGRTGELKITTAKALRGTCRTILAIDEAGDSVDVTSLDVEALLDRWENLNRTKYSSGSLATYRSRFRQSVAMFRAWLVKDSGWKRAGKASSSQGTKGAATPGRPRKFVRIKPPSDTSGSVEPSSAPPALPGVRLVAYEMPLRPDLLVRLTLPVDLSSADAERLSAFVRSLAFAGAATRAPAPPADPPADPSKNGT